MIISFGFEIVAIKNRTKLVPGVEAQEAFQARSVHSRDLPASTFLL
jgi:hypothetical protein